MRRRNLNCFCLAVGLFIFLAPSASVMTNAFGQTPTRGRRAQSQIPQEVLLRIVRAEDERRWDDDLMALLSNESADVRRRAALATGRIGDERAVPSLVSLLEKDSNESVRAMAAFALGETESPAGADALAALSLNERKPAETRARAVEALGKIAAALPKSEDARARPMREAILRALEFEAGRRSMSDREVILAGLTAALRARPENVGKVIARFLGYSDARVRADAANALARLRLNDGNGALRKIVTSDPDPIVRANAARVLGATEDKAGFDALLDRAIRDADLRVRVGTIRALGALKDPRAAPPLLARGERLFAIYRARRAKRLARPTEINEILEIATALGRVLAGTKNERAVVWLRKLGRAAPEVDIAFARIAPATYVEETTVCCPESPAAPLDVRYGGSSVAQGWGEIASNPNALTKGMAGLILRNAVCLPSVDGPQCTSRAKDIEVPDHLRAYVAFKPNDIAEVLRKQLKDSDVIVRATAAELLGNLPPDETNTHALVEALPVALKDKELNDAALATLDALGKQKSVAANETIKTVLDSTDYLIRRRAVALLKANGVGDFSDRIGTVQTRNTTADYERAIGRIGRQVRAVVTTSKGSFVIELLSEDAPLTVDNFVMLARKGFFNGQMIPPRGAKLRRSGRRSTRRYERRARLSDSLRDQRSALRSRRGWHGPVGQRHRRLAMVRDAFATAASRRRLHRLWSSNFGHGGR